MGIDQRRQWQPTPELLPGKSHVQRSLVGCSPWGCEEWDTTERLHFHFSLSRIGEGNGSPLQCSCLENPREGGAWWAAVCGVAHSQTRLKSLSSSSMGIDMGYEPQVKSREGTQIHPSTENWIKDLLSIALSIRQDSVSPSVSLSHEEASVSLLSFFIRGQTE